MYACLAATLLLQGVSTADDGAASLDALLAGARRDLAELSAIQSRLEARGVGQYSRMQCEVAAWCLDGMEKEELPKGFVDRVRREIRELESFLGPALARAREIDAGRLSDPAVPRFKSGGAVRADGSLLRGDRVWPDGRVEKDVPLIFTGWGHFGRAQKETPILEKMGFDFIQMESGLYRFLPNATTTNEDAIAEFIAVADRAYAANTRVDLLFSPHYIPGWVNALVPKDNGECKNGFIHCCIHNRAVSDVIARYCSVIASLAKDHPALHAFCLTNEPHSGRIQECREVRRQWAEHLKMKFDSVESLNAAWGTSHAEFEDVELQAFPELAATPAALEYIRFDRALSTAFHKKLIDATKAAAPDVPVHSKVVANEEFFGKAFETFWSIDLVAFARMFDYLDQDALCFHLDDPNERYAARWKENEAAYDFLKSFAAKPLVNTENHNIVDKHRGEVPSEHVYATLWQQAIHGQTAAAIWCWERGLDEKSIMVGLAPEHPNCLEALGRCSLDLKRLSVEIAPLQAQRPTILVLRSLSSAVLRDRTDGQDALSAYAAATFLGETVGFITDDTLEEYARDGVRGLPLDTAKVILLPSVTHLPRQAFDALRKLEEEGVQILAFGDELRADDCNRPMEAASPWPSLAGTDDAEIFDVLVARMDRLALDGKPRLAAPVFGVETRGYLAEDGRRRIALCNQLRKPVAVELESEGVDLITGQKTARSFELKSRMPMFVEY
ncbi:MAG: beta-galactosidase [Kiritimatiellia bacterium]